MPEGPEIHRAAAQLAKVLVGAPLERVFFAFPALKPYEPQLQTQKVLQVQARGKAMLIHFDQGLTIYSHNQLYGVWKVVKAGGEPVTGRQLRLGLYTPKKSALLYSASDIAVLDPLGLEQHPYLTRLGPDVVDPETSLETVLARYQDKAWQRKRLISLLLDQHFLGGLGNYLRSEILFVAGVPPTYRPIDCSPKQCQRLAEASLHLPRQSFATAGITNDLERVEKLKAVGISRTHYRFYVFDRAGEPCYTCGTLIVRIEAGGRRLYYCPHCQAH
jgi:endonuclease-8